jgi:ATP-binding cassette subfamily C protein CydD
VEGVEALDVYYGLFRPQMIVGLATPLLICAVVAAMDWMTGLVLLVAAPLAPLLMGMLQKRFRQVSSRYYARAGQLSAQFLDSVQGLPVLKMFNRGRAQGQEIFRIGEMLRRETMRLLAVNQLAIFLMDWGFALGVTTVAFVMAALRWKAGALSLGEGVAVILLSVEVIRQLNLLGAFFFAGAAGRTMIKAIREYLGRKPAVNPGNTMPGLLTSSPARPPSIRFEHVTFAYDRDGVVLDDVHFTIGSGKTVALTGASGAGKSSLVHLLLRFADPQRGRILLDGRPLTEYPLSWLRSQMAVVAQDTWLFHGTIADNLRIARPRATLEEMETAARAAGLQDFIVSLPRGYDTPLGERGARLSGGQAQRLAIARAILKDAPILILDEPTSHLDSRTEETVLAELDRLSRGKTVLHITHRLHTIRNADRLVVLREGGFRPKETPVAT